MPTVKPIDCPDLLPIDSPERKRLPPLLRRAWYGLNQAFRRRTSHLKITPDQFTVLRTLLEHDGITQRELTHLMASDPNTVASLLERMEASELLERLPHQKDKRAYRLHLKPNGKQKYEAAREIAVALQAEVMGVLPQEDREKFLCQLAQIADTCQTLSKVKG